MNTMNTMNTITIKEYLEKKHNKPISEIEFEKELDVSGVGLTSLEGIKHISIENLHSDFTEEVIEEYKRLGLEHLLI